MKPSQVSHICTHMANTNAICCHNCWVALCIISKISADFHAASSDTNSVVPNHVTEISHSDVQLGTHIPFTNGLCTTYRICFMLPALVTRRVLLFALFQLYKRAQIYHLHIFRVAMASRRFPTRPLDEQPKGRAPVLDPFTYVEIVITVFEPNQVLLRRIMFLNDDKSKYV